MQMIVHLFEQDYDLPSAPGGPSRHDAVGPLVRSFLVDLIPHGGIHVWN